MIVYLDMDGVLADFVSAAIKACRLPIEHDKVEAWNFFEQDMLTESDFWSIIDHTPGFWDNIAPYWELPKIKALIPNAIVCTRPSKHEGCASAKLRWLRRYWNPQIDFDHIHMTAAKWQLAGPDRLLIDDNDEHVAEFMSMGGPAILYPRPWNSLREWSDMPFSYLKSELARYGITEKLGAGDEHLSRKAADCTASG